MSKSLSCLFLPHLLMEHSKPFIVPITSGQFNMGTPCIAVVRERAFFCGRVDSSAIY